MLFRKAVLALAALSVLAVSAPAPKKVRKLPEKMDPAVRKWMRTMTLREEVAPLIVMPIYGEAIHTRSALYRKYQHFTRDLNVGGLIVTGHVMNGSVRNA